GYEITRDDGIEGDVYVAGAKLDSGKLLTAGGRVLGVVAIGDTLKDAIDTAYANVNKVHFDNAFYRKDIGQRAMLVFNQK
ncbi:MAG: phosphoribosylamine--glycine ligase, partial [Clostridia bacterium]|nr:phosphoribosylamine--glycine ligase [Clostridia bacterium]